MEKEKIPIDFIVRTSIGSLVGATYALNPVGETLERRLSEVLDPKENGKAGLTLLGQAQWDDGVKSDFLRRIVRIAQKGMLNYRLRKKVIQWPKKINSGLEKRGY